MCIYLSFAVGIDNDADHALLYCVRDVNLRTHSILNELRRRWCIILLCALNFRDGRAESRRDNLRYTQALTKAMWQSAELQKDLLFNMYQYYLCSLLLCFV